MRCKRQPSYTNSRCLRRQETITPLYHGPFKATLQLRARDIELLSKAQTEGMVGVLGGVGPDFHPPTTDLSAFKTAEDLAPLV